MLSTLHFARLWPRGLTLSSSPPKLCVRIFFLHQLQCDEVLQNRLWLLTHPRQALGRLSTLNDVRTITTREAERGNMVLSISTNLCIGSFSISHATDAKFIYSARPFELAP